jgi:hypothetical protein
MNQDWTEKEVNLIVEEYFKMLGDELSEKKYNKSKAREQLLPRLNNRTNGSIEFKHQNISAALIEMGLPFIKGYKPRFNYQQILVNEIRKYIEKNKSTLEREFEYFSNLNPTENLVSSLDFEKLLTVEPINSEAHDHTPLYNPIKVNYLEKEQNNRNLGEAGEELILEYERWRLINLGKENLAEKVEWISKEKGDGAGFDILSKNNNGTDRYIEVKTTKLSKETPIFLTRTELSFATVKQKDFYLYRVYEFSKAPKFYIKQGKYESFCTLQPQTFKGFVR